MDNSDPDDGEKLFDSSTYLDSWTEATAPNNWYDRESDWLPLLTPCQQYGLTTYHSQLVLVGGTEVPDNKVTNKLWVLEGNKWEESSLPPMPTARHSVAVANPGSPDCIIAAGGFTRGPHGRECLDTVEVLLDYCWSTVRPLPEKMWHVKPTLHDGSLYVIGECTVCKCDVKALIESADTDKSVPVWSSLESAPLPNCSIASCGKRLITIGGENYPASPKVYAYSPGSHSWVYVGKMPVGLQQPATLVLPYDDLAVIGGQGEEENYTESDKVFRGSLAGIMVLYKTTTVPSVWLPLPPLLSFFLFTHHSFFFLPLILPLPLYFSPLL